MVLWKERGGQANSEEARSEEGIYGVPFLCATKAFARPLFSCDEAQFMESKCPAALGIGDSIATSAIMEAASKYLRI